MALTAYSLVSAGLALMKKGVSWMGWRGERSRAYYRNLAWWVSGFILMNIYGIPSAVALKHLPPHIVAACAGWGIVTLVFLSRIVLNEKLDRADIVYSILIVAGITLLNFFELPDPGQSADASALLMLCAIPLFLFIAGFIPRLFPRVGTGCRYGCTSRVKTVLFASVSGMSAALMVVFLKLLVLEYQYRIGLYFQSLHLYGYAGFALLSFIALQMALKNGPMMAAGPVQYSATILFPVPAAVWVFDRRIAIWQYAAVALIVFAVARLLKKR